jgi:hypothetical protein
VELTTHPHLLPLWAFMACSRENFTFYLTKLVTETPKLLGHSLQMVTIVVVVVVVVVVMVVVAAAMMIILCKVNIHTITQQHIFNTVSCYSKYTTLFIDIPICN